MMPTWEKKDILTWSFSFPPPLVVLSLLSDVDAVPSSEIWLFFSVIEKLALRTHYAIGEAETHKARLPHLCSSMAPNW